MGLHIVVGAGVIGSLVAQDLVQTGNRVRLVSRRGIGPVHPAIERIAADANDQARLVELTAGAEALYNCANPPYHRWPVQWPPLAASLLRAAERSGAVLVTMSNLYGYGPVDRPMSEDLPLAATSVKGRVRAQMWRDALAAHQAGRVRATEVRASDYIEANSIFTEMVLAPVLAGKVCYLPVDVDLPHAFTSIQDVARLLVTVATDEQAWGRPWHVPTDRPYTVRQLANRLAELAGAPTPKLRRIPGSMLWLAGLVNPMAREFREVSYQFTRPFIVDSSAAQAAFGLRPTPVEEALKTLVPHR
jgi:nucleoside-diphosphate-sugar epimerase